MDPVGFFAALDERARRDTSVVSHLRRSLADEPGTYANIYPWIEPWVSDLPDRRRHMVYLVAGLWALAERRTHGPARALADAVRQVGHNLQSASVESRFAALLDADDDELVWRMRHIVQLVAAEGIAIDWPALLSDLFAWNNPNRRVQQQWARRFWQSERSDAAQSTDTSASTRD